MTYKKNDSGKLRYDLIPPEGMEALAEAYTRGVKEGHSERGWEAGGSWLRLFAAMMRHAWQWRRGEDYDSKSGIHHLASVAFYCFALITYTKNQRGEDDRRGENPKLDDGMLYSAIRIEAVEKAPLQSDVQDYYSDYDEYVRLGL